MEKHLTAILAIQDLGIRESEISSFELSSRKIYKHFDLESIEKIRLFVNPKSAKHLDWKEDEENWMKFETRIERSGYNFEITIYQHIE